jgi:rfaE bifunctional protein nucleotidyltransferase chain/domain
MVDPRPASTLATAFVLGAGLGTRLRPLTDTRPKPLVPVFNKPLITFAFDHLIASGVEKFVVNTHHRPEAYGQLLGESLGRCDYRGHEVFFRHEPVLLETGGGIKNAAGLLGDAPFLVYNGDVLADFPLAPLLRAHTGSGHIATLALRSTGTERRIQFDAASGLVTDMRGLIGGRPEPAFLYTGVGIFSPEIHNHIADGEIVSIIPVLVDLMRRGARVGGVVVDDGVWFDIGNIDAYLEEWRRQDLRIGFTNGCFDILHPGHVKVLTAARGACDRLIVGLNSDASVKRLKGEGRPVQNERARAEVLAALEAVDLVAIFEEDTPINLITKVRPSVLVKGGDYTREQVVGHEIVEAAGGEVVLVEILQGHSTTSLVARAREGKA